MINEIYFVDDEKIDCDISNNFKTFFELKNKKIEKINLEEVEKLDKVLVYLTNGKVWEAFFRKEGKLYLNTEITVSLQVK